MFCTSEDIGLPYMMDGRHAPDTFFIVAEADHRFYEADCIPPREWLAFASREHFGTPEVQKAWEQDIGHVENAEPSAGSSSDRPREHRHAAWTERAAEPSGGGKRAYGAWEANQKPMKKAAEAEKMVTDELRGLVAMANQAARAGVGDFIWFSWNPTSRKGEKLQPSMGTNLVGCTVAGAKIMRQKMDATVEPYHFDLFMRDFCRDPLEDIHGRCCFCYPPTGNFIAHESGIDKGFVRENYFHSKWWIGQPVIPRDGSWRRQLLKFSGEPGHFEVLHNCSFDDWQASWWTSPPPSDPSDDDETWQNLLWQNWWVDCRGQWLGPSLKGKGAKARQSWNVLVYTPGKFVDLSGHTQPISCLASQLVVDQPGAFDTALSTDRYWTVRRKNILAYKARKFSAQQACPPRPSFFTPTRVYSFICYFETPFGGS